MKRVKSLVFKGVSQIACQSVVAYLGNAGYKVCIRPRPEPMELPDYGISVDAQTGCNTDYIGIIVDVRSDCDPIAGH